MKFVTYNIQYGLGKDDRYDLARIAREVEAADVIAQSADPEAQIIFGAVIDPKLDNEVKLTVIATGFDVMQRAQRSALRAEISP